MTFPFPHYEDRFRPSTSEKWDCQGRRSLLGLTDGSFSPCAWTNTVRTVDPGGKSNDLTLALTGVDTRGRAARPSPDRTCAPREPGARALSPGRKWPRLRRSGAAGRGGTGAQRAWSQSSWRRRCPRAPRTTPRPSWTSCLGTSHTGSPARATARCRAPGTAGTR